MFAQDSFFTLSQAGQVGLVFVSLLLSAICLWAVWQIRAPIWLESGASLFVFWAFIWLSPQLYYAYYSVIIDGLPRQSVIQAPPSPLDLMGMYGFADATNLSKLSQSGLGWCLLLVPAIKRLCRNAAN